MSIRNFKTLLLKSAKIQAEIEREQNGSRPDWMRLLKLKKLRLVLRDRLQRLSSAERAQSPPRLRA